MRLDNFNNPIFNEADIFDILYQGKISALPNIIIDESDETKNLSTISEIDFMLCNEIINGCTTVQEFDKTMQHKWFIPPEYETFDVKEYCIHKCNSTEERTRVIDELTEFERLGMGNVLRWCKYFVDTCTKEKIVWGVGRGSSTASYVLYLIGIHRINSIKYNLDWHEFLR